MGFEGITEVRIGKHIELVIDDDVADAEGLAQAVADKLLANPVIEAYTVTVVDG